MELRLDEEKLLAGLASAIAAGRVRLELDRSLVTHAHSPVSSEAEANLLLLLAGLPVASLWWLLGWEIGLAVAGGAFLGLMLGGNRVLAHRVRQRVLRRELRQLANWRRLWRFGGVTLTRLEGSSATGATCHAPADSWQQFAQHLQGP